MGGVSLPFDKVPIMYPKSEKEFLSPPRRDLTFIEVIHQMFQSNKLYVRVHNTKPSKDPNHCAEGASFEFQLEIYMPFIQT